MKLKIKRMQNFTGIILCVLVVVVSGCSSKITDDAYPKTGKYGLNILADGFVEAKKTEWGRYEYSLRAELPKGASLKIVIKPASTELYVCHNRPDNILCDTRFTEGGKCPICGEVNNIHKIDNEWGGWNQGSDFNWVYSNVGSTFTCNVYKSGKAADASVIFTGDCIIEFYENGAKTPTKVKEIKVIN